MSKLSDFLGSLRPHTSKVLVERDTADFYALAGTLELARGVVDDLRASGEGEGAAEISAVFLGATEDFLRGRAQLGEFIERVAAVVDWREGGYAGTWPPPYGDIRDLLARVTRGSWERRAGLARGGEDGRYEVAGDGRYEVARCAFATSLLSDLVLGVFAVGGHPRAHWNPAIFARSACSSAAAYWQLRVEGGPLVSRIPYQSPRDPRHGDWDTYASERFSEGVERWLG